MYKCTNCKKVLPKMEDKIRCPYCGFRIFIKERPEIISRVQAR